VGVVTGNATVVQRPSMWGGALEEFLHLQADSPTGPCAAHLPLSLPPASGASDPGPRERRLGSELGPLQLAWLWGMRSGELHQRPALLGRRTVAATPLQSVRCRRGPRRTAQAGALERLEPLLRRRRTRAGAPRAQRAGVTTARATRPVRGGPRDFENMVGWLFLRTRRLAHAAGST